MYLKFVRLINFYWGLISTIIIGTVFVLLLTLVTDSGWNSVVLDVLVELSFAWGIFLGVYLIRLNFRKAKYPFLSHGEHDFHNSWLQATRDWTWFWLILIPCFFAILGPALWFFLTFWTLDVSNSLKIIRGLIFGGLSSMMIINNLVYVGVLRHKQTKMQVDFSLQRLS